jgi:type II secretory pathway pseudopilin PulG
MAALLVALSVMAILSSAAMPVWSHMSRREKEEELIFRGQQYARAIGLFQRRAGPGVNPSNLDILVQQRFLRKKYKDPITGGDFVLLSAASAASARPGFLPGGGAVAGQAQGGAAGRGAALTGRGQPGATFDAVAQQAGPAGRGAPVGGPGAGIGAPQGGIVGVASKSTDESIRIYNGRNRYNEWQFVFIPQTQAPGGPGQRGGPPGTPTPGVGGRGGRGIQPSPPFGPGRGNVPPQPRPPGR